MLARKYLHRIQFQVPVSRQDPLSGAEIVSWETAIVSGKLLSSVPALVLTGPGREVIAAGSKHAETTARINTRWFEGLQASWRILWDGKAYNISGIATDITGRREYRMTCVDGVSDGQ